MTDLSALPEGEAPDDAQELALGWDFSSEGNTISIGMGPELELTIKGSDDGYELLPSLLSILPAVVGHIFTQAEEGGEA